MPAGKASVVGVWEDRKFIGCLMFSCGANNNIGKPFKLNQTEICELTRVALTNHVSTVSKIGSLALKMLKRQSPGLRLVVSYADLNHGHLGKIYQAMNWIYVGMIKMDSVILNGKRFHRRTVYSRFGFNSVERLKRMGIDAKWDNGLPKHKYLFPLDNALRKQIEPLCKPYPKRGRSDTIDTAPDQGAEGGVIPTLPLQHG